MFLFANRRRVAEDVDRELMGELELLNRILEIYDSKSLARYLNQYAPRRWTADAIKQSVKGKHNFSHDELVHLKSLLPEQRVNAENCDFRFIDLFAGIGGLRSGFESVGGMCVFTSEIDKFAMRTYKANFASDPVYHCFNRDITEVTLSGRDDVSEREAFKHIDRIIPNHDVLLAGFPCQPFSIAGVSKRLSLGVAHGFCDTQGTLFFDVARIIAAKRPGAFVLENVKNLKSHDNGKTFEIIMNTLDELGYVVADARYCGKNDPKVIDAQRFLPQHRERIVLVGFRKDLNVHRGFTLKNIAFPSNVPLLGDILENEVDDKYILTPKLWKYLYNYAEKHKKKGNGFGFGLVGPGDITRTLSARYYKDGSEILVDRGWDFRKGFSDEVNIANRPRRLTPMECARLMGFVSPGGYNFKIPVSDTQAYKQFGNSVAVPVFHAVANLMHERIINAKNVSAGGR